MISSRAATRAKAACAALRAKASSGAKSVIWNIVPMCALLNPNRWRFSLGDGGGEWQPTSRRRAVAAEVTRFILFQRAKSLPGCLSLVTSAATLQTDSSSTLSKGLPAWPPANIRVRRMAPDQAQALAKGTIGGSLKILCRLGIGGCNVRNEPNCISAQLVYSFSGP